MKEILDDEHEIKTPSFKVKHVLILFLLVSVINSFGSLFKMQHWPFGSELLTLGTLLYVPCVLLAIIKMIMISDPKSFLNK